MRFYTKTHQHYCGIDLHAKTRCLCILDSEGAVALHRNIPCGPEKFLRTSAPYRDDLVVAVECMFSWYWLADLCAREGIAFVLGRALYMKAIHGAKAKNDKIDSKQLVDRLAKKHGKGKALSILAHRIGRAAYFMLKRKRAFDLERFLRM